MIILANKSTNDKSDLFFTLCLVWEIHVLRESSVQVLTSSLFGNTSLHKFTIELGHVCIQNKFLHVNVSVQCKSAHLADCSVAMTS